MPVGIADERQCSSSTAQSNPAPEQRLNFEDLSLVFYRYFAVRATQFLHFLKIHQNQLITLEIPRVCKIQFL